jgi:zinc protease
MKAASWPLLAFAIFLWPNLGAARLDLAAATVERLDNGLTVLVLEEPAFPLVSVQMLYRVGAKHEALGATGLAHFLEHMAFRSSENFPDTGLVSSIYAAGGEWHGYTWLDQTTYFATAPRDQLDLLLRIEADRMARLLIPENDVKAEIGAVLAEMHGYENDPATVLQDHVLYVSFLAHSYRNNTIGWESDIAGISHAAVVDFYRQHYHAANAVLAIVGDVRTDEVVQRVRQLFGDMEARPATPNPRTVEPAQQGERRVRVEGATDRKHFKIAWRAPSVNSPDYASFLVLQELLAGGSGASFLQNDWGTAARADSPLWGITSDIASWYPPSEQDYIFIVSGSLPAEGDEVLLETSVQHALAELRSSLKAGGPAAEQALQRARETVARELTFDVQTTEDAAHQLAFFAGMDALAVLTGLPAAVEAVGAADVLRALESWLQPWQRTIGWYVPGNAKLAVGTATPRPEPISDAAGISAGQAPGRMVASLRSESRVTGRVAPGPMVRRLENGVPLIMQPSPLSPTLLLKVVVAGEVSPGIGDSRWGEPLDGVTSLDFQLLPGELEATVASLRKALVEYRMPSQGTADASRDPGQRLEAHFRDLLGPSGRATADSVRPLLFVISGDFEPEAVQTLLEDTFAGMKPVQAPAPQAVNQTARLELESVLDHPVAQERLGYLVRAPGPNEPGADAFRMALYILSHGYEGRLGKEAISRRGLVYYIDSAYRSNGVDGWVTLDIGVDPAKLPAMRDLLRSELQRLLEEPPSQAEIDEARRHLLGRFVSAAQSNAELADRLSREWLWSGELTDYESLSARLGKVTREDVLAIIPGFTAGAIIAVRNPPP